VFVAGVGVLLILTGAVQLTGESVGLGDRRQPTMVDAILVGAAQALAILPGVSRSGMTTSVLLFEGYDPPAAFRLSFLISIPAGIGATALVVLEAGGLPEIGLAAAILALAASVIVGYLAIDVLLSIVEQIPFWAVCFGLGALALLGGAVVVVVG
jgi:undecaprenyl-diphosphatase